MKKIMLIGLVAMLGVVSVQAQDAPHHRRSMNKHHRSMAQLNLTQEQKEQMKTIHEDSRKQMQELGKNEDITVKEWKARQESIRKSEREQIQNILTPEQKAKMAEARTAGKQKWQEHAKDRMDQMKTRLNLTDDQSKALEDIRMASRQKIEALRTDKTMSQEDKREAIRSVMKDQRDSLKSILTTEQLEKMEQMKQHRPHRQMSR